MCFLWKMQPIWRNTLLQKLLARAKGHRVISMTAMIHLLLSLGFLQFVHCSQCLMWNNGLLWVSIQECLCPSFSAKIHIFWTFLWAFKGKSEWPGSCHECCHVTLHCKRLPICGAVCFKVLKCSMNVKIFISNPCFCPQQLCDCIVCWWWKKICQEWELSAESFAVFEGAQMQLHMMKLSHVISMCGFIKIRQMIAQSLLNQSSSKCKLWQKQWPLSLHSSIMKNPCHTMTHSAVSQPSEFFCVLETMLIMRALMLQMQVFAIAMPMWSTCQSNQANWLPSQMLHGWQSNCQTWQAGKFPTGLSLQC